MRLQLFISFTLSSLVLALPKTPACPKVLRDLQVADNDNSSPTLFTKKFSAFVDSISSSDYFTGFSKALLKATENLYDILRNLEDEVFPGSMIPYPENTMTALYEFIIDNQLHCYAKKNPRQLFLALVEIDEAAGTGGMSDFGLDVSDDENEVVDPTSSVSNLNNDPRQYFEYLDADILQVFGALANSFAHQLKQLDWAVSNTPQYSYSRHEQELLDTHLKFWRRAEKDLGKVIFFVQNSFTILMSKDEYDEAEVGYALKNIAFLAGEDYKMPW